MLAAEPAHFLPALPVLEAAEPVFVVDERAVLADVERGGPARARPEPSPAPAPELLFGALRA